MARRKDPEADVKPGRNEAWHGVRMGLLGGSAGGVVVGLIGHLSHAAVGGYGAWLCLGLLIGFAFALGAALLTPPRETTMVTPSKLLISNRGYTLLQTGTVGIAYGLVVGALTEPVNGLVFGPAIGIAFGVGAHAWGRWVVLARFWLPATGRLPWPVWGFLADAHSREILRQAGAVYEFRHDLLRQSLAARYRAGRDRRLWGD